MLVTHNVKSGNASTSEDILSQTLATKDPLGAVREVGKFIMPTKYFHTQNKFQKWRETRLQHRQKRRPMVARVKKLKEEFIKIKNKQTSLGSKNDVSPQDIK